MVIAVADYYYRLVLDSIVRDDEHNSDHYFSAVVKILLIFMVDIKKFFIPD